MFTFPVAMTLLRAVFLLALACGTWASRWGQDERDMGPRNIDVLMPNVRPTEPDQYVCASQPVNEDLYIVNFIPQASMKVVHHMLLYGCQAVDKNQLNGRYSLDCFSQCKGQSSILFAWARNAPPPRIPEDVGFHIGGDSGINYLTLQIHYGDVTPFQDGRTTDQSGLSLTVTTQKQQFMGGIYLNMGMQITVRPRVPNAHTDLACLYDYDVPIYAFAFRTHAHDLGKVISGYRIRDNNWELIAKGNPQWPQAFYPMTKEYELRKGDVLATRCTFDGTRTDHTVHVGSTHNDEMCNLYIMYYTNGTHGEAFKMCSDPGGSNLFSQIPPGSDTPPLHMPRMDKDDHQDVGGETLDDNVDRLEDSNLISKVEPEQGTKGEAIVEGSKGEEDSSGSRVLNVVDGWPQNLTLGQVGGVHTDSKDNLVLFHRGDTVWDIESFDMENHYLKESEGQIKQDTVYTLDKNNGSKIHGWGADLFYMPHGIFVDHKDNIWVTDVALHQVLKFPPGGSMTPLLTIGSRMKPGDDHTHFCKPADVVVNPHDGSFFVADGYCNSRIIKFSAEGEFLMEIDENAIKHLSPPNMLVVHSVTLAHNNEHVCAADREHGRILCFDARTGKFLRQIELPEFGGKVYAAQYSPQRGGILFVINGPSVLEKPVIGITVHYTTGKLLETWSPHNNGFSKPHDVTFSSDANEVYVGEIGPNKVWKFVDPVHSVRNNLDVVRNLERDSLLHHDDEDPQMVVSKGVETKDFGATAVILVVLAVPIILMMVIAVVVRLQAKGKLRSGRGMFVVKGGHKRDTFSIGNFFNKQKGFSQVSTDDSDHEGTTWSEESDVEEYSILNSKRTQNL